MLKRRKCIHGGIDHSSAELQRGARPSINTMTKSVRRSPRHLANHASSTSNLERPRRGKGRARTRASGVKILDDPMQDEKRLKDQLTQMGLYAVDTLGDGNCLFRALSDQLYGTPSRHLEVRHQVCSYLAQNESRYKAFVDIDEDQSWDSRLERMSQQGTYGGHLELSACANFHRRPIKIIQPGMVYVISHQDVLPGSSTQNMKLNTKGKGRKSDMIPTCLPDTPLYLVYHQWEHYSSVRNIDGPHSGIPHIRESDLENSVSKNHQVDHNQQEKEETNSSSDSIKQIRMNKDLLSKGITTYREPMSSPDSVGSVTTPMSSAVQSISPPYPTPLTQSTNIYSSDCAPNSSLTSPVIHKDNDLSMRNSDQSNSYQIKTRSQSSHKNSPSLKSKNQHHLSNNSKKPLSKKERRKLKRSKTSDHHHHHLHVLQSQCELNSDTSVLLKELKV